MFVCAKSGGKRKEKGKHRRKCRVHRWEGVLSGGMWQGCVYRPQKHRTLWFCSSASARLSWFATVNQKPRWHSWLFKQFVQFSGSMWLTNQQKTTLLSSASFKHGEEEVEGPCCGPLLPWARSCGPRQEKKLSLGSCLKAPRRYQISSSSSSS